MSLALMDTNHVWDLPLFVCVAQCRVGGAPAAACRFGAWVWGCTASSPSKVAQSMGEGREVWWESM